MELLGLLLPVLIVGTVVRDATTSTDYAAVGDCLHRGEDSALPDITVVPCSDPDADYRVVARFDSSDPDVCDTYPGSEVSVALRRGPTAYTLCLSRVGRP
ncbi:hypothetical protein GCM10025734_08690 [Kitasatospora paranensis]|uniref:LppU/SCO3897 family protein n=1 Tax=Kitasatospora paranensis TaxID=258053 RepID=UPI0031F0B4CD